MFKKEVLVADLPNVIQVVSGSFDSAEYRTASIEVTISNLSVTHAPSVTATLQSSADGTNWKDVKTTSAMTTATTQFVQASVDAGDFIGDTVRIKLNNGNTTSSATASATLELK